MSIPSAPPPITPVTAPDEIAAALAARRLRAQRYPDIPIIDQTGVVFEDEYVLVHRDAVRFPGGALGTYLRIEERSAQSGIAGVVVLPVMGDVVYLQRIYRYPTQSWEWELPRGFLEPDKTPAEMVRRELQEETGLEVSSQEMLGTVLSNSGLLAGGASIWLVTVRGAPGAAAPEDFEAIGELRAVAMAALREMIGRGEIRDAFTLSALALAEAQGKLPLAGS